MKSVNDSNVRYLTSGASCGLTLITGILGKTIAAARLLARDEVEYALDFDVLINRLSRTLGLRVWSTPLLDPMATLCLLYIQKLGEIAVRRNFRIAVAILPEYLNPYLRLCSSSDLEKHFVDSVTVVNATIRSEDVEKFWKKRFADTGNWAGKGRLTSDEVKIKVERDMKIIDAALQGLMVTREPYILGLYEGNSARHYETLKVSYANLLLHATAMGDMSMDEIFKNNTEKGD